MSSVKEFSNQRHQDKKHQNLPKWLNTLASLVHPMQYKFLLMKQKKSTTKWIFCLLIHLPNQINQFPQVSIHSVPQHTAWCHCLYTMYFLGYFCIPVSHSRKARPHGMWCGTRFTHFVHNTQTTIRPHNSESVTIPSSQFLHQSLCF